MNPYIGHDSQLYGIEEHRLIGGKGDGMRLLEIHNGKGMDLTVVPDRGADISRLRCKGINLSYFSPCGYVAPAYYEATGDRWLKSFTAGFLTTCGLNNVGTPNFDSGQDLPLHGSIANQPAEQCRWWEEDGALVLKALIKDETLFAEKLRLEREYRISLNENSFLLTDTIENTGGEREPFEILYHMNMGYPLLSENSVITIPSDRVVPRDEHAGEDMQNWMRMEKPQAGYTERCYYHSFRQEGRASIYQPDLNQGLQIEFDAGELDGFVEWKMMGIRDYVLGLECGNCYPDGRAAMRKSGMLKFLEAGEKKKYQVKITLF